MDNPSLFLQLHLPEIIFSSIAVTASIVILYLLRKKPAILGFKEKPKSVTYFLALAPLVLLAIFLRVEKNQGLTYPTGISVHQNTIVVTGIAELTKRNTVNDDIVETEEHDRTFLFDKASGKQLAVLPGFVPMYFAGNSLLGSANFGYHIVDLATGEVSRIVSEDDIKSRAGSRVGEKIYSIEWKNGATSFDIRTVKDKNFIYDPVLEKETSPETHAAFNTGYRNEKFESTKVDLFLAEELGKTKDGVTLVLSYDDLEKKSFLISAISAGGELLWTKRDTQISPDLASEEFTIEATDRTTVMDDQYFYFVNKYHLVCASIADGKLKWIVEI